MTGTTASSQQILNQAIRRLHDLVPTAVNPSSVSFCKVASANSKVVSMDLH